jgi:hypothetical protein
MEKPIKEYSGRAFSLEEIELIQWTVRTYPKLNRHELAKTVCEFLGWLQISGKPKTRQCLTMLSMLEEGGQVKLPPLIKSERKVQKRREMLGIEMTGTEGVENNTPDTITQCGDVEVTRPQSVSENRKWTYYVQRHHTLGCAIQFGAQLRYFIRSDGQDLGCLQFSASAWALAPRDKWIGWTQEQKKARLQLIVNNSRFLILPWVRVKNLASRALAGAAGKIQADWLATYCYEPVLLETFVDTTQYSGTCYKAANWKYVGITQGRGRQDRHNERALSEKAIYMYPLQHGFREILKGTMPFKVVTPDE